MASPAPFSIVAKKHHDGCVLLSTASDRIFKLNDVGALTWIVLEQNPNALSLEEVVDELHRQFDNIDHTGEMRYEVSREQLQSDTNRFLKTLAEAGLVRYSMTQMGRECYRSREEVSATTSTTLTEVTSTQANDVSSAVTTITSPTETSKYRMSKRETLTALFAVDLLLRFRGFEALIKKVEGWPTAGPHTTDPALCLRLCAAVNRAQVYYPKKAMCLQHSATHNVLNSRSTDADYLMSAHGCWGAKSSTTSDVVSERKTD